MREVAINPAYHTRASEQRQRRHSPATPRYLSNMASRGCHAMKISTDVTGHKVSQRRQRQTDRQTDDKWMCMWSAVTRWSVWRHRRTQLQCNYSSLCPLDDKTTITSLARSRRAPQHQPCRLLNFTSFHDTDDSTDSPDCSPILLSISVYYFLVFFLFSPHFCFWFCAVDTAWLMSAF